MKKRRMLWVPLMLLAAWTAAAQDWMGMIPEADRELLTNLGQVMYLPQGTHKIYNGQGNTVFDVLYTIDVADGTWKVYKGGTKSTFDALYSIVRDTEGYKVYKGDSNSMFNILYMLKTTPDRIEVYKGGDSGVFPKLLYSYERNR